MPWDTPTGRLNWVATVTTSKSKSRQMANSNEWRKKGFWKAALEHGHVTTSGVLMCLSRRPRVARRWLTMQSNLVENCAKVQNKRQQRQREPAITFITYSLCLLLCKMHRSWSNTFAFFSAFFFSLLHKKIHGDNADWENESVLIVGPFCSTFFSYLSLSCFLFYSCRF